MVLLVTFSLLRPSHSSQGFGAASGLRLGTLGTVRQCMTKTLRKRLGHYHSQGFGAASGLRLETLGTLRQSII